MYVQFQVNDMGCFVSLLAVPPSDRQPKIYDTSTNGDGYPKDDMFPARLPHSLKRLCESQETTTSPNTWYVLVWENNFAFRVGSSCQPPAGWQIWRAPKTKYQRSCHMWTFVGMST